MFASALKNFSEVFSSRRTPNPMNDAATLSVIAPRFLFLFFFFLIGVVLKSLLSKHA